jgi:hypothetical protein
MALNAPGFGSNHWTHQMKKKKLVSSFDFSNATYLYRYTVDGHAIHMQMRVPCAVGLCTLKSS